VQGPLQLQGHNLLLECFFMLQNKFQQLTHGALVRWLPDVFVLVLWAKQSLALTLRGVPFEDRR
jgi:hypothetical protein